MRNEPLQSVRCYLLWAAACILSGWTLSALRWLTPATLAITLPLVASGLFWLTRGAPTPPPVTPRRRWTGIRFRRFRRPQPLLFAVAALLVFVGGAIYAPNNYDALTYRLPRMLHWLSAQGWTWITTNNDRMNYSGTGWEWMALPLLVLRSDRALFLINAVGFLLLPGLIFSVFRHAGVASRVAWFWMWILPLAFGFALQAGSIGNDMLGAIFCLISVQYGLRARRSRRVEDVWLAGLAAAIMTGIKASNLPLALPCLVAAAPALKQLRQRRGAGILVAAIALVVSFLPLAVLNQKYAGSWNGDPDNGGKMQIQNPVSGFLGNSILLGEQLLMPPVLPGASKVNAWVKQHMPAGWTRRLEEDFPRFFIARFNELPQEETASLGIGIAGLLVAAGGAAVLRRGGKSGRAATQTLGINGPWLGLAAWVAGLVFMTRMGSEADARLMLPYYPLGLIPILRLPGQDWLVLRAGWRWLAGLAALCVLPCLILTPSRPLWPAAAVSQWLAGQQRESALTRRLTIVYSTYQNRNDLLAPLRAHLPDSATDIGFIAGGDDSEYSLWRPLGRRRVVSLRGGDQRLAALPAGVEWIVVKHDIWQDVSAAPLETWAAQHGLEIVRSVPITSYASATPATWSLWRVVHP